MNILFIANFRMTPDSGGVQRVTNTLAEKFRSRNKSVFYLALHTGEQEVIEGVEQYYLPSNNLNDLKNSNYLSNFLDTKKIDVIINQGGIYKNVIDFIYSNNPTRKPLFTVHHNTVADLIGNLRNIILGGGNKYIKYFDNSFTWKILQYRNKKKYGKFFKNAIEKSDKVVLLSKHFEPELEVYLKEWDKEKVTSIPNPAPFPFQNINVKIKDNKLLYVGRVEYTQKQINILIDIWDKISSFYPDWSLDIVGGGSKLEAVKTNVRERNIPRIFFHGFKNPIPFFKRSKILCMTSSFEGFGMVLVEAQAYSTVPIAFNAFSSIHEIIVDNESGKLINPFDVEEYIFQLRSLMDNEDELRKLQKNSDKVIKKFDANSIVLKWETLIQSYAKG